MAVIVGVALIAGNLFRPPPVIDPEVLVAMAEQRGYVSPEVVEDLREQAARTQADLDALRRESSDLAAKIDRAIRAFNEGDIDGARAAFAEFDRLIADRRAELRAEDDELRVEQARSLHAQATLFYPFAFSESEPLLCQAAELAESNVWYWLDCGRARVALGSLDDAPVGVQHAADQADRTDAPVDVMAALIDIGAVHWALVGFPAAVADYQESLAIARDLAARDPGNAGWARDVMVILDRIGDVRVAQGDLPAALAAYQESLAIRRDLAARDPGNAGWARDLSVSLNRVGDVRRDQGDLPAALAAFEEGLTIRRDLAARDPGNAGWTRDVSVSLDRIGDVRVAQGDLPAAIAAYEEGLAMARELAARDPGNAQWARDVVASVWRMAVVDPENAAAHWSEVVARMEAMQAAGTLLPTDVRLLEVAREALAAARN